ncbi:MAG: OmpA family protein [Bacteroidetes bacterium]|nr:OmpA family protein [Bacteroidota bacterium]
MITFIQYLKPLLLLPKSLVIVFVLIVSSLHVFSYTGNGFQGIVSDDPCKIKLDKKTEKIYQAGIDYLKRSNYFAAGLQMRKALDAEPACVDAYYALGVINLKKTGYNLKEAEKNFLKVLELCPAYDIYTYFYMGEISYGREDYEKTIAYLGEFIKDVDKIKKDEDYNRALELIDYSKFITGIMKNPVPFEPKVVEGISTSENEYLPILSPDNQMALFTREIRTEPDRNSLTSEVRAKEKFFFSICDSSGAFEVGEEMPRPFNINDNEGGATLTADNNSLYYTVCRFDAAKKYLNCDIYLSENIGGAWQPIHSISNNINSPGSWESQPTISADGKTLYFVSDRSGGFGGYDIYRSIKGDNGEWSAPVNLGSDINSMGNEKSPFIHPDSKTLYFSSDGLMGLGGYDVFFTKLNENGIWQKPRNIGYPINSPDDEVGFFVSTDGTKGFFASNKFKGKGGWDLYSFDLYDGARPEKVLFIRGNVKSEYSTEPLNARIELKNMETRKVSEIPMDSITGNYVAVAPFNSDYIMTVKKTDHVYESKYISKFDSLFKFPAKVDIEMKPIELNKSYRINDIYFPFNSFELQPESKAVLDLLFDFLLENPNISIQVQGHTDNIGNDASNLKLSESRAESVYKYLIEKGIELTRLTYKGFGKSIPVASNDSEEGRAKNRRTVFVIIRK